MRVARIIVVSVSLLLMCAAAFAAPARLSLGDAVATGDHFVIPVYVEGNVAKLEAMAFRVNYPHASVASATVRRAGITAAASPLFETSVNAPDAVGFIASFNQAVAESSNLERTQIAEVEVTLAPGAPADMELSLDPALSTLGQKDGANMLSVAKGTLSLGGVKVDRGTGRSRAIEH